MKQELSLNYTNVCWYCGAIYKSNRVTSKYCSKKHNSLYHKYGSQIKAFVNEKGQVLNLQNTLKEIYSEIDEYDVDGWGVYYSHRCIVEDFEYRGPLPTGNELVLVTNYLIRAEVRGAISGENIYSAKPFTLLTEKEKRTSIIVNGKIAFRRLSV